MKDLHPSQQRRNAYTLRGVCFVCCKRPISPTSTSRCAQCVASNRLYARLRGGYKERPSVTYRGVVYASLAAAHAAFNPPVIGLRQCQCRVSKLKWSIEDAIETPKLSIRGSSQ